MDGWLQFSAIYYGLKAVLVSKNRYKIPLNSGSNFLGKYLVPFKKGAKFVHLIYIFYRI